MKGVIMNSELCKFKLKNLISLLLVSFILATCVACNKESNTDDTFSVENPFSSDFINNENVMFAYGFGTVSPSDEETIKYNGSPIEIEYYIDNAGATMNSGMSIFLNGIPQEYQVEGSKEKTYMHITEVKEKTIKRIKISFIPVIGVKGEILNIRFISILNPQIRPNKLEYLFAHTNSMTTFLPRKLQMMENSPNDNNSNYNLLPAQREMTKEELNKVIYIDSKGNQINKFRTFNMFITDAKDHKQSYINNDNGHLNILMQSYGGPEEKYLIIPYINHIEFSSNTFPSILSIESGHKIFEENFQISINNIDRNKYKIKEYNTFYILAIPLSGNNETDPIISESLVFKGE